MTTEELQGIIIMGFLEMEKQSLRTQYQHWSVIDWSSAWFTAMYKYSDGIIIKSTLGFWTI